MPAKECTHGDEKLIVYFTWPNTGRINFGNFF